MSYRHLLSRLVGRHKEAADPNPHQGKRWDHFIPERHISANALKVLAGLQEAGFTAYLVGGGVRDLLAGKVPKDFDVATSASPEEIRRLFRNSRIIGRRFRLVHVFYRREIIEVSTYRALIAESAISTESHARIANNTFGSIEEDAWRRDFTVNALYYDARDRVVVDYTGGMEDLRQNLIRMIGDPAQRFHEDPVRLLRAIRLSAKLDFQIHAETEKLLQNLPSLLQHVAKSRLFDEVLKLFFTGHAAATYRKLCNYQYFDTLFPQTFSTLKDPSFSQCGAFIELAMQETDRRYEAQNSLNPGFLLAVLLWPPIQKMLQADAEKKLHQMLRQAIDEVFEKQSEILVIPHRLRTMMCAIWLLQFYLVTKRKQRAYRILHHRYFRAALDFLGLRVKAGEPLQKELDWWQIFREADVAQREKMLEIL